MAAKGSIVGCFRLTEPNHGSNPGGMECRARRDAGTGEYILNGTKSWLALTRTLAFQ